MEMVRYPGCKFDLACLLQGQADLQLKTTTSNDSIVTIYHQEGKLFFPPDFLTKPVDPDALPIFYYNLFSCQEKAIEKMCSMKEDRKSVQQLEKA